MTHSPKTIRNWVWKHVREAYTIVSWVLSIEESADQAPNLCQYSWDLMDRCRPLRVELRAMIQRVRDRAQDNDADDAKTVLKWCDRQIQLNAVDFNSQEAVRQMVVDKHIELLPERQREVLRRVQEQLRLFGETNISAIAEEIGIAQSSCSERYSRGLINLRESLGNDQWFRDIDF